MVCNKRHSILLASVYRPFAVDTDDSRKLNPLELCHNQITRMQGPFSFRNNQRSAGLLFIAQNIGAQTTVLDFPTFKQFCREIKKTVYDYIGISSIMVNITKTMRMVEAVRKYSPQSKIVIGGHIAAVEGIEKMIDADHFVRGDGVAWFRKELGEDLDAALHHPSIEASFHRELLGIPKRTDTAWLVPGLGCPNRCEFCCTSHFFDGYKVLLKTGQETFDVCCRIEKELGVTEFFVLDENFLLNSERIYELHALMKTHGKKWDFSVFASADVLRSYDLDFLVEFGVQMIWVGIESKYHSYHKNEGIDLNALISDLRSRGIVTIGSTIIGMDEHTYERSVEDINNSINIAPDMQQFMLYMPLPGTALWRDKKADGTLLSGVAFEDMHGQYRINWAHPHITCQQSEELLSYAFKEDYHVLGPSIYRMIETRFIGIKHYENHPNSLIRARQSKIRKLVQYTPSVLWAMEKYLRFSNPEICKKICALRHEIQSYFGVQAKLSLAWGPLVLALILYEHVRRNLLEVPHEPKTLRDVFNG